MGEEEESRLYIVVIVLTFYLFMHLSQAENCFYPCRVGELFSENLQYSGYVQTGQLIIYKKKKEKKKRKGKKQIKDKEKFDNLIE